VSESLTGLSTEISSLNQGLTLVNSKIDSSKIDLKQMVIESVSTELSKLLVDDKFVKLQKAFESLVVEV